MNKPMMMPLGGVIPGLPQKPMMGSLMGIGALPVVGGGKGATSSLPPNDLATLLTSMMGRK